MTALIWTIPWLVWLVLLPIALRRRPRLADYPVRAGEDAPRVSVILPARNEAINIGPCIASILDSAYPAVDVVVVDDGSVDGTLEVAQALAARAAGRLQVVAGEPLPPGWVGKPWACWQGYRQARGELLLFTDADTRHAPTLLGHAVGAMEREAADLVSIVPRQLLRSFWERSVMPHVLTVILTRYLSTRRVNRTANPRDVVANGQFILVRRAAYEAVGGHEAVRGEVVEDLRLAQRFVAAGKRLFLAYAEDLMSTRMYRSFGEMVEGWSKNLAYGSRAAVDAWLRPVVPWLIAAFLLAFWVLPPAVLVTTSLGALGGAPQTWLGWSALVTATSVLFWGSACLRLRVPMAYAVIYPLGALVAASLFIRSALLGPRVSWRGRRYGGGGGEAATPP
jgi:chlorobactene glucosyltransferase